MSCSVTKTATNAILNYSKIILLLSFKPLQPKQACCTLVIVQATQPFYVCVQTDCNSTCFKNWL